jgi:hypothetical protein
MSIRSLILIISAIGTLAFGSAFVLSYTDPGFVESITRELIRRQVESRVKERIDELDGARLASIAGRISGRNATEIADARRMLEERMPARIAETIAEMRKLDCECRKVIERRMNETIGWRILDLSRINERLQTLIQSKYMETAKALTREFRIFTGANAALFMLLAVTTLVRTRATLQLALPALVLIGAAGIVAFFYVFEQDWLRTVVFADYVGLGYFAYLGLAIALLADIAFNRARITTEAVNVSLHALGSAVHVLPC